MPDLISELEYQIIPKYSLYIAGFSEKERFYHKEVDVGYITNPSDLFCKLTKPSMTLQNSTTNWRNRAKKPKR